MTQRTDLVEMHSVDLDQKDWMTLRYSLQPLPFCDSNVCENFWSVNIVPENFMPHLVYAYPWCYDFALRICVLTVGMTWT